MKKYPIYHLSAKWSQDGEHDQKYPNSWMYKDMPEGRIKNSSGSTRMFKTPPTDEELAEWKEKFEEAIRTEDSRTGGEGKRHENVTDYSSEIEFKGNDSWCITWFSHYTFDEGQTDEEVLRSFQDFVDEKTNLNADNGHWNNEHNMDNEKPYYCLMGAEDRWRWTGSTDDAKNMGDTTEAPCRCIHCKNQGVIRINH